MSVNLPTGQQIATQTIANKEFVNSVVADGVSGLAATVATIHTADGQVIPLTGAQLCSAFVALVNTQTGLTDRLRGSTGNPGAMTVVNVPDNLGASPLEANRRILELILCELQALNSYFLNSGMVQSPVSTGDTVQTFQ